MKSIALLAFVLIATAASSSESDQGIPRIVWVYMEPSEATFVETLCLRNIQHHAQQSNFQLRVVTPRNYTSYLPRDTSLLALLPPKMLLPTSTVLATLAKLTLLHEHGGVWLELPLFLVEGLTWLDTLDNQRFINNRISNPEVVLFYEPTPLWGWLDETEPVTQPKTENIVVAPRYTSWFVAARPHAVFLRDWRDIYLQMTMKTYASASAYLKPLSTWWPWHYLDEEVVEAWTARMAVELQQVRLNAKE